MDCSKCFNELNLANDVTDLHDEDSQANVGQFLAVVKGKLQIVAFTLRAVRQNEELIGDTGNCDRMAEVKLALQAEAAHW